MSGVIWGKIKASRPDAVVFVRQGNRYLTYGEDVQTLIDIDKFIGIRALSRYCLAERMQCYSALLCDMEHLLPWIWRAGRRVTVVEGTAHDVSESKILQRVKVTKRAEQIMRLPCVRGVEKSDDGEYIYTIASMFGSDTAATGYRRCELVQFTGGWIVTLP